MKEGGGVGNTSWDEDISSLMLGRRRVKLVQDNRFSFRAVFRISCPGLARQDVVIRRVEVIRYEMTRFADARRSKTCKRIFGPWKEGDLTETISVCQQRSKCFRVNKKGSDFSDRPRSTMVRLIAHREFTFKSHVAMTYLLHPQPLPNTPTSTRLPCMHSHPKILPSRPILAYSRVTSPLTSVTAAAKTLTCTRSLQCGNSGTNDVAAPKRRVRRS
jgi:hypothetical protein